MLKLRTRRKSYQQYYNRTYGYKQPKRNLPWLKMALSVPILLLLLELCAQGYLLFADRDGKVTGQSPQQKAYQLQYLTHNAKKIDGLENQGKLEVQRNTGTGYKLVSNQESQFYTINEQGFREKEQIPLQKEKGEIRIFILGGSTAFGSGSGNNNATIAHKLETLLQNRVKDQKNNPNKYRPDIFPFFQPSREPLFKLTPKIKQGNYRVINAAVPGYTSGNELAQLALEVLPYQPDMIILINGYGDLMLSSEQNQADIPNIDDFLANASGHFTASVSKGVNEGIKNLALVKTTRSLLSPSQAQAAEISQDMGIKPQLPKDEAELKARLQRYKQNQQRILQIASKARIPVIVVQQPEITRQPSDQLTPPEKAIQGKLNKTYREKIPTAYQKVLQTNQNLVKAYGSNTKLVNLYSPNFKGDQPLFIDSVHLTEEGNKKAAYFIYYSLAGWKKMQIIPENFYLK